MARTAQHDFTSGCASEAHIHSGDNKQCFTCKAIAEGYTMPAKLPPQRTSIELDIPKDAAEREARRTAFAPELSAPFKFTRAIHAMTSCNGKLYISLTDGNLYEMEGHRPKLIAVQEDFQTADEWYAEGRTA